MKAHKMTLQCMLVQALFWGLSGAVVSFARIYLQRNHFDVALVGTALAVVKVASSLIQPLLADLADRSKKLTVADYCRILIALTLVLLVSNLLFGLGGWVLLSVFLATVLMVQLLEPLSASVSSYYLYTGEKLNYGMVRAAGAACFGILSVVMGFLVDAWGETVILWVSVAFCILYVLNLHFLPQMKPFGAALQEKQKSMGLLAFAKKYRRFMLAMVGVFFLGAFHVTTETYMIDMAQLLGGGESDVGVVLFCSCAGEISIMLLFEKIRHKLKPMGWICLGAVGYILKGILYLVAWDPWVLYVAGFLHICSYGLFAPAIIYFAKDEVAQQDMVKGQALIVSFKVLGGSAGILVGGWLISGWSVQTMLYMAMGFAIACLVLFLVVLRSGKESKV